MTDAEIRELLTERDELRALVRGLTRSLEALGVRWCWGCGCIDERACDGGCRWAAADLCSQCVREDGA